MFKFGQYVPSDERVENRDGEGSERSEQEAKERKQDENFKNETKAGNQKIKCETSECIFMVIILTVLLSLFSAARSEVSRHSDDLRALVGPLPRPCTVASPSLGELLDLTGDLEDERETTVRVLCNSLSDSEVASSLDVATAAISMLFKGSLANASARSLGSAICTKHEDKADPFVRVTRAYLGAQSAFESIAARTRDLNTQRCAWSHHPFLGATSDCAAGARIMSELDAAAGGGVARGSESAMPEPLVALYRLLALSVFADSDMQHNAGRCVGNPEALTAEALCDEIWAAEASGRPTDLLDARGDERGDFERWHHKAASMRSCSATGALMASMSPPSPPPLPPLDSLVSSSSTGTGAAKAHCKLLHTIGPWDLGYQFGIPDLRRHADAFGGDSFAESVGGWLFSIVTDNLRGDVLDSPQHVALLYAIYRKSAFFVWATPMLYATGWYFPCSVLPLLFIALRPLSKVFCASRAQSELAKAIDETPVVAPPAGGNRYLAMITSLLALGYVFVVHPAPSGEVSRPTCEGFEGRVFAPTDSGTAVMLVSGLAAAFVGTLLFYWLGIVNKDKRVINLGPKKPAEARSTVRSLSVVLALVALPGAVVALVDSGKRAIEQVATAGQSSMHIAEKVDEFIKMAEILTWTAFFHGVAVGVWSNAWILDHASVDRKSSPLGFLQVLVPVFSALAAFAPRFKKLADQSDLWFPPRSDLRAIDLFAYVSEIGLVVVCVANVTRRLFTYQEAIGYAQLVRARLPQRKKKRTGANSAASFEEKGACALLGGDAPSLANLKF